MVSAAIVGASKKAGEHLWPPVKVALTAGWVRLKKAARAGWARVKEATKAGLDRLTKRWNRQFPRDTSAAEFALRGIALDGTADDTRTNPPQPELIRRRFNRH